MIVIVASVLFIIALCAVYVLFLTIQLALYDNTKDDLLMSAHEARNLNRNKKQIIAELKWINKKYQNVHLMDTHIILILMLTYIKKQLMS